MKTRHPIEVCPMADIPTPKVVDVVGALLTECFDLEPHAASPDELRGPFVVYVSLEDGAGLDAATERVRSLVERILA